MKVVPSWINTGKEVLGKMKNLLHPDKVKEAAKKVYDDYIKSPLQKGYTYFKNYTKKLGDVKTPLTHEAVTPLGSTKVPKTVSEVTQDLKKATVQMAKKLDEKIGGKGADKYNAGTMKHIYHGEINKNGKAVGYHHESMRGGKVIPGTESIPDKNGVYRARLKLMGLKKWLNLVSFQRNGIVLMY